MFFFCSERPLLRKADIKIRGLEIGQVRYLKDAALSQVRTQKDLPLDKVRHQRWGHSPMSALKREVVFVKVRRQKDWGTALVKVRP